MIATFPNGVVMLPSNDAQRVIVSFLPFADVTTAVYAATFTATSVAKSTGEYHTTYHH